MKLVMLFVVSFFLKNMSESCQKLQTVAYSALRGAAPSTHIASFGNSDILNVSDWVQIIGVNEQALVVSSVSVRYC